MEYSRIKRLSLELGEGGVPAIGMQLLFRYPGFISLGWACGPGTADDMCLLQVPVWSEGGALATASDSHLAQPTPDKPMQPPVSPRASQDGNQTPQVCGGLGSSGPKD